ncbi:MAG: 2,3-bisphosphoglycerate-dependent phosphoglycerate mutase [Bradymonadales bacterium]|nr:MAG: 2,3-bisphosphoglycerate-dependent phosphoglycerate mutase [Bradymonadales bacterium]
MSGVLILVRHGQSQWNLENRFTGWVDVDLSPQGEKEAKEAGRLISGLGMKWVSAHTSRLLRAKKTLDIVLDEVKQRPAIWEDSALNERHYGELQGLDKDETRKKYGQEQVHLWRRSFDVPPPGGECLADTAKRSLPYFKEYILKSCMKGENVLVAAHGNSIRAIVMDLEGLSPEEILKLEIETGRPYLYEISSSGEVLSKKAL